MKYIITEHRQHHLTPSGRRRRGLSSEAPTTQAEARGNVERAGAAEEVQRPHADGVRRVHNKPLRSAATHRGLEGENSLVHKNHKFVEFAGLPLESHKPTKILAGQSADHAERRERQLEKLETLHLYPSAAGRRS